ncbi:MAG: EscU/YscU/HrcU family type III secretion system export apparatus switch protein [Rhodospirillales bacterium]|nr:EscU/YscU/HrcU family type III secretion system export apparatus switch protein [Rhodospirillales bacterium]
MAGSGGDTGDRTESATPRRLQHAREQGQVALSREVAGFAAIATMALALGFMWPSGLRGLTLRLGILLRHPDMAPEIAFRIAAESALRIAAPIWIAGVLATTLSIMGQTGFLFSTAPLKPDLSRLNPLTGLRRVFGVAAPVEAGKALLRLAAFGTAGWWVSRGIVPALRALPFQSAHAIPGMIAGLSGRLLMAILAVQAVITTADVIWVRMRHARSMRMTRQEIRDEQKEDNGDPAIKARMRRIRQQRSRARIAAAVPKATVVVTNPTHYAVALRYERATAGAPRVVAKGVDSMAARIRELAGKSGVPLVADPPLARALYRLEVDAEIPPEHYKAVAELIAYVWRIAERPSAIPPR